MLRLISGHGTNYRVFIAGSTVDSAVNVSFGFSSIILGFTLSMFFFAALLPGSGTSKVADGLDNVALDGVILAGSLAIKSKRILVRYLPQRVKGVTHTWAQKT